MSVRIGIIGDRDGEAATHAGAELGRTMTFRWLPTSELAGHPFLVATLFVPQLRSGRGRPHPLVMAFLTAVLAGTERPGASSAAAGG